MRVKPSTKPRQHSNAHGIVGHVVYIEQLPDHVQNGGETLV